MPIKVKFSYFFLRSNSGSITEGFLLKAMKHLVQGCQVCSKQFEPGTLESGPSLSIPNNRILKRINFPEVIHIGVSCGSCQSNPIKGNAYRCWTCKDFVSCETCHESMKHQHILQFVSSKF